MAGSKTDYYEAKILNLMRGEGIEPWTPYIALFTAEVSESSPASELDIEGYARQQVVFSVPESAGEFTQTANSSTVTFPLMTGNGEQVVAVGYFDAQTGGNLCYYDNSISPVTIDGKTVVEMAQGDLKVKEK